MAVSTELVLPADHEGASRTDTDAVFDLTRLLQRRARGVRRVHHEALWL